MRRVLLLAGLTCLALAGLTAPASAACKFQKVAELPVTMSQAGPTVPLKINGGDARLILDSGAFFSMLTPESAKRLGLPPSAMPKGFIRGVNGRAPVEVSEAKQMLVADAPFRNVDFLVGSARVLGLGVDGFLGESFLGSMDVEYDLPHGVIRMFRNQGCGDAPLIYWSGGQAYSTLKIERGQFGPHDIEARARVNGSEIHVILDTGAWRSILTTLAAAKAGVRPGDAGVQPAGFTGGIGRQPRQTWIGSFNSFSIGDDETRGARLLFGDLELADADMLLGADFFLSHRVLVANSQHRIYFTRDGSAAPAGPDGTPAN